MLGNHLYVSDLGEKKLIKRIINKLDNFQSKKDNDIFKHDIGDDSALININFLNSMVNVNKNNKDNETYLVASSDLLIQNKHFPKQMSYFQMGQKSVTVNVSDLAAMGAKPSGILISLAIPFDLKLNYFDEIIDGILEACYTYKIPLIGGDTNETDQIIISGTALGVVNQKNTLKKSGFSNGDYIAVTGEIGLASLGFEILKSDNINLIKNELKKGKLNRKIVDLAIEKALNPQTRINEGQILGKFASSATDITDGLVSELYELKDSNINKNNQNKNNNQNNQNNQNEENKYTELGLKIYEDKLANIPHYKDIANISKILNKNPLDLILHIGEDFEILFTFNPENNEINKYFNENLDYFIIGEINNTNKVEIQYLNGETSELSSKGYEHFN